MTREMKNERQIIKDAAKITEAVAQLCAALHSAGASRIEINRGVLAWYLPQERVTHMCDLAGLGIEFPKDTYVEFDPKPQEADQPWRYRE